MKKIKRIKRKICVVITARPSYSRVKSVLQEIKKSKSLTLQIVVTGSSLLEKYGNVSELIENDKFNIDAKIYNIIEGEKLINMVKSTGVGIIELASVFVRLKPDLVITIADRHETIATAIASSYMNIPLAHIQGGEVTGSIDEKVRHSITKLSDLHFVANKEAYSRVCKLGENKKKVFNTGCPSIDIAKTVLKNINKSPISFKNIGGVGNVKNFSSKKDYLVVMQHPVTTEYSSAYNQIEITLKALKKINMQVFWFWPNIDAGSDKTSKKIREFRENQDSSKFHFLRNMESEDFLKLLYNSKAIVGNSSVAIRECSFLGVPAINIGNRQIGRARGNNVIDVPYNTNKIINAINKQIKKNKIKPDYLYGKGNTGKKIVTILEKIKFTYTKKITY